MVVHSFPPDRARLLRERLLDLGIKVSPYTPEEPETLEQHIARERRKNPTFAEQIIDFLERRI